MCGTRFVGKHLSKMVYGNDAISYLGTVRLLLGMPQQTMHGATATRRSESSSKHSTCDSRTMATVLYAACVLCGICCYPAVI